ncbi:TIGR03862 family flavoprotein [Primorskyibacter sp. S187A]|uniref:TIGR03862 family flavoprotein n=1 Tax=Primorskyibacter sp. S187A TaxID=3415130 RepID=UPI003C7D3DAD
MTALVIGAGPAGLMAADVLSAAGQSVLLVDQKPSFGRKFLMAGKSGLNVTKAEDLKVFLSRYDGHWLTPMIKAFGPEEVQAWVRDLGQVVFTGTTGRVFPKAMKASPLLRAWLARLAAQGVATQTRWQFLGWDGPSAVFTTPEGQREIDAKVTIMALGGGSWARLGSDGAWAGIPELAPMTSPFLPSNTGLRMDWSEYMRPHFGKPIKAVRWSAVRAGEEVASSRGEAVLSERGLEGGGIYPLIPALRAPSHLVVDFAPDLTVERLAARLPANPKGGLKRILRNTLRWPPEKIALFNEMAKGLAIPLNGPRLAKVLKAMNLRHQGLRPLDEAISTAGGLHRDALDEGLMLKNRPGVFACGEMLDWDAPTGGYLITACLATGRWAGRHALKRLEKCA